MHILWRNGLQDDDYLQRYCLGVDELRERVRTEYPPGIVAAITGIAVADIERLAHEYGTVRPGVDSPELWHATARRRRHGGADDQLSARGHRSLARYRRRRAAEHQQMYPFNNQPLERPDLIPPGTRTINMVQLAEALDGRIARSAGAGAVRLQLQPGRGLPRSGPRVARIARARTCSRSSTSSSRPTPPIMPTSCCRRPRSWSISTCTAPMAICTCRPTSPPSRHWRKPKRNTEVFRLLARRMGFEPELFEVTDEQLAAKALETPDSPAAFPPKQAFAGISLERLRHARAGAVEFAEAIMRRSRRAASGRLRASASSTVRPWRRRAWTRCRRIRRRTRIRRHGRTWRRSYPLQMVSPPAAAFLNSTFVNVAESARAGGRADGGDPPRGCGGRGIVDRQWVRVFNDRGGFRARALVGETVKRGVVVTLGVWWNKYAADGVNCNTTTSSKLTDFGGGATFFDNLVEVRAE